MLMKRKTIIRMIGVCAIATLSCSTTFITNSESKSKKAAPPYERVVCTYFDLETGQPVAAEKCVIGNTPRCQGPVSCTPVRVSGK
jgi:hypothetical protein